MKPISNAMKWSFACQFFLQTKASKDGRSPSIWDAFCALPGKIQNGDTGPELLVGRQQMGAINRFRSPRLR